MNNSEATTKPTLETILERINAQGDVMRAGFAGVNGRLDSVGMRLDRVEIRLDRVEIRLDQVDTRLDRVESRLDRVHSMVLDLRADFKDFQSGQKSS